MKIGLCEKDLRGTIRENLEWISSHGFSGFQIWKKKMDSEGLSPQDVLSIAGELGLEVSAVGGGPNLVDPACADESISLFKEFIDLSVELGPAIVTAETKRKPETLSDEEAWNSTVSTISAITQYAEEKGAYLAIEPAGPCFIRDHDMFLELREKVPSSALVLNYDPANIVWAGKDASEGVQKTGEYILHTHAKDIQKIEDSAQDTKEERHMDVPAGEGLVGYSEYLPVLNEAGYTGYLTIEMHAGEQARKDDILKSKENIEKILGTISKQ